MFPPWSPPDEKGQEEKNLPNSSALINLFADASLLFFCKRRAISGFGFFVFGIIQLDSRAGRGGVDACIQGFRGKLRRVHSHWFVRAWGGGGFRRGFRGDAGCSFLIIGLAGLTGTAGLQPAEG